SRPPGGFNARVAPALPSQTPFSPDNGPRFTCPSGQCGVGRAGGRALPLPFPFGAADSLPEFKSGRGSCAAEGATMAATNAPAASAIKKYPRIGPLFPLRIFVLIVLIAEIFFDVLPRHPLERPRRCPGPRISAHIVHGDRVFQREVVLPKQRFVQL